MQKTKDWRTKIDNTSPAQRTRRHFHRKINMKLVSAANGTVEHYNSSVLYINRVLIDPWKEHHLIIKPMHQHPFRRSSPLCYHELRKCTKSWQITVLTRATLLSMVKSPADSDTVAFLLQQTNSTAHRQPQIQQGIFTPPPGESMNSYVKPANSQATQLAWTLKHTFNHFRCFLLTQNHTTLGARIELP